MKRLVSFSLSPVSIFTHSPPLSLSLYTIFIVYCVYVNDLFLLQSGRPHEAVFTKTRCTEPPHHSLQIFSKMTTSTYGLWDTQYTKFSNQRRVVKLRMIFIGYFQPMGLLVRISQIIIMINLSLSLPNSLSLSIHPKTFDQTTHNQKSPHDFNNDISKKKA